MQVRYIELIHKWKNEIFENRCFEINKLFNSNIFSYEERDFFYIKQNIKSLGFFKKAKSVLHDSVINEIKFTKEDYGDYCSVSVMYKKRVTDNLGRYTKEAFALIGEDVEVASGKRYLLKTDLNKQEIRKLFVNHLCNELIHDVYIDSEIEFKEAFDNNKKLLLKVDRFSASELETINKERGLALNKEEISAIKRYMKGNTISDVELEVIAQSWSEHCKHKIFNSHIDYSEQIDDSKFIKLGNLKVDSLFKTYIKEATNIYQDTNLEDDITVSVFDDNAGIVNFDEFINICVKVETHNSPSALDPYGGALTGILGVNRDILGCGIGASPIANMDVFCFPPLDLYFDVENKENRPKNVKGPLEILNGVHKGVEDGGNKSGIPTVGGALYYDKSYAGKPLVYVGSVGVIPKEVNGVESWKKNPKASDLVVVIGGDVGKDGIRGANFSSMELDEKSSSSHVQIGDPFIQKRVTDFIIEARDMGLYSAITDNGAGGLSSSIGEMAQFTNGVEIELSHCSLKHDKILPYEIIISESQERMTLAVPKENIIEFKKLAKERNVGCSVLGEFNESGKFTIKCFDEIIAQIDLNFLHNQNPRLNLQAVWDGPRVLKLPFKSKKKLDIFLNDLESIILHMIGTQNLDSREWLTRRYDHEVKSATLVSPHSGKSGKGASDGAAIWLYPHGGEKNSAITVGHGLNPRLSQLDPYIMAQVVVDEALRNIISVGGDPQNVAILDNFCWPDPVSSENNLEGEYKLGQLVRCCKGLFDAAVSFNIPIVSGKDSMKNDYKGESTSGKKIELSILPTLLITAVGKLKRENIVTTDFKDPGDLIYIIGGKGGGLQYSEFSEYYNVSERLKNYNYYSEFSITKNVLLYQRLYQTISDGLIKSCHDISDGGAIINIIESMLGNQLGVSLELSISREECFSFLFNEEPGRFITTISQKNKSKFESTIGDNILLIGNVSKISNLTIKNTDEILTNISLKSLETSLRRNGESYES